jgi:hypothetical protein
VDRDEVRVTPDSEPVEHLPRSVEQRMVRVRRWQRDLLCLPPSPAPPLLRNHQFRVRGAPTPLALAFAVRVGLTPRPEVVGRTPAKALVRLADLLTTTVPVAGPVARLALPGAATACVGVVTAG